jgi:arylsulfatase A-like enzyme
VHPGEYSTDLVRDKSVAYLDDALASDEPFFLGIAPIASHSWIDSTKLKMDDPTHHNIRMNIPASHPRHANMFADVQAPRPESWNPDEPQGVSWVRTLPKLNATQEAYLDEFYRGRIRTLQAVDELVDAVVQKLKAAGQLDNTYIFYTCESTCTRPRG